MYNFEHEIGNLRDRRVRYFLAGDYFHDSYLTNLEMRDGGKRIDISLVCERDWQEDFARNNAVGDFRDQLKSNRYRYTLVFHGCRYMHCELVGFPVEYINGRFKDSVMLARVGKRRPRHLHFRMQVFSWVYPNQGYIDLIFNQFDIRRDAGPLRLPRKVEQFIPFSWAREHFSTKPVQEIRRTARRGPWLFRSAAIQYLGLTRDRLGRVLARRALNSVNEDVWISAVYSLGILGNAKDLGNLTKALRKADSPLAQRHVLDAIDRVLSRTKTGH